MTSILDAAIDVADRQLGCIKFATFLRITEGCWGLHAHQQYLLLGLSEMGGVQKRKLFYDWRAAAESGEGIDFSRDTKDRISYVVEIHKASMVSVAGVQRQRDWLNTAAPALGNLSPIQRMSGGSIKNILAVMNYCGVY